MTKALFAGSFDPVTKGHLDIIRRAAKLYDELVVAVTVNLAKTGMFTPEERMEMIRLATADLPNVRVDRIDGLRADYVNENQFTVDIRSLRNTDDFNYEIAIAHLHATLYNNTETVFLMSDPALSYISSSMVRQVFSLGGDASFLLDATTLQYMRDHQK